MKSFVLELTGSITIGNGDTQLTERIQSALDEGYDTIIVDFENVNYMDSAAVGELARCYALVTKQDGQIALTRLQPKIRRLLQMLCFLDMFQVYDSVEDALQIMWNRKQAQPLMEAACA